MTIPLLYVLLGAALLVFGRRLFWLFVAGMGFVVGMMLATDWLGGKSDAIAILIALGAGVIGAILSVFLQRASIAIGGLLSGGYLAYTLALSSNRESIAGIAFLVGGVIGAVLVIALFDWALIGLSALTGATIISQNIAVEKPVSTLLFFALLVFGIIVQSRQLTRAAPAPKKG